jgi:LPPG:FO 2-phospho-L-lactate transferase
MRVAALAGGVGGAKLVDGLTQILAPENLSIIVNIGDDFEYLGLYICPDLDTVCYTVAGIASPETGWGRNEETWNTMENLVALGGPSWFRLGDKDLGTHLERSRSLKSGQGLSEITKRFCRAWGIRHEILPASDDRVQTYVGTDEGELPFQEYFVKRQCQPRVRSFHFDQAIQARPAPGVLEALQAADLAIVCPSNPWVSIDPILAIPGIRQALSQKRVLAVSPIIGGQTVKGPAAKMYSEMGISPSALAVARHYGAARGGGLLAGFVLDLQDNLQIEAVQAMGIRAFATDTWMKSEKDRIHLAENVLAFAVRSFSWGED